MLEKTFETMPFEDFQAFFGKVCACVRACVLVVVCSGSGVDSFLASAVSTAAAMLCLYLHPRRDRTLGVSFVLLVVDSVERAAARRSQK